MTGKRTHVSLTGPCSLAHLMDSRLNDPGPGSRQARLQVLHELAARESAAWQPEADIANLHCHTFFSFNAFGYSPAALAWLGKCHGYRLMGIVDFDVLDGVDEFLDACELLELRGSAGIETRCIVPEFASDVINSPGEPGIAYHMGVGFASSALPPAAAGIAAALRDRVHGRNRRVIERVNAYLDPVRIDYEQEVLPLTPNQNATERHIVVAYLQAAQNRVADPAAFWAARLGMSTEAVLALMGETGAAPAFQDAVRARLIKRGGVGYVQPGRDAFPTIAEFHRLIEACGALPCVAWLDGTSAGEQRMPELLALLIDQGVVALNIIPDRNWNIADPEIKKRKLHNLYEVAALAESLDLPTIIGTEMNSFGQPLYDDLTTPELALLRQAFLDGAHFVYGHTMLLRHAGLGYQSAWAQRHLPSRKDRNAFYTLAGYAIPPTGAARAILSRLDCALTPAQVLTSFPGSTRDPTEG